MLKGKHHGSVKVIQPAVTSELNSILAQAFLKAYKTGNLVVSQGRSYHHISHINDTGPTNYRAPTCVTTAPRTGYQNLKKGPERILK
ncbi:hypothetical protein TNCV_377111 [Trichonephila clavipes]|nr:hypothetical protein TNCV_377111 [Trichonephila clavipes]